MKKSNSARLVFVLFLTLILVIPSVSAAPGGGGGQKYYVNGYVKTNTGVPIFGASVKLYIDGSYINTVTTQSNGYFSGSAYRYTIPRTWKAVASKTGFVTATKTVRCGTSSTTYMGIISLYPLQTQYFIHGYVKNIYNNDPVCGASVTIFGDGSQIGSTTTDQDGYYYHSYSTFDTLSSCRVEASAVDYYDNYKVVSVSGVDINMGTLGLFHIGGFEEKYAVLVGVSDYYYYDDIDLHYCDEDVTEWYSYLKNTLSFQSENIWVYGDGHSENYPKYDGDATEANVEAALENMIALADMNDIICFFTICHGGRVDDWSGRSYLAMYDYQYDEEIGKFHDSEVADIFEDSVAETNFFFFGNCFSGGFGPELMALSNAENTVVCAACSWEGSNYECPDGHIINGEFPEEGNSLWTIWFFMNGLMDHFGYDPFTTMEDAFDWALANYPSSYEYWEDGVVKTQVVNNVDFPVIFDGDPSNDITLL
ncbi:MAG: hypothetical protein ACFFFO_17105 [Candidatus Thorarchaeota archaeon]